MDVLSDEGYIPVDTLIEVRQKDHKFVEVSYNRCISFFTFCTVLHNNFSNVVFTFIPVGLWITDFSQELRCNCNING